MNLNERTHGPDQPACSCSSRQLTPPFLGRESHLQRVHRDEHLFRDRVGGQSVNALMHLRMRGAGQTGQQCVSESDAPALLWPGGCSITVSSAAAAVAAKNLVLRLRPENLAERATLLARRTMSGDVLRSVRAVTVKKDSTLSVRMRAELTQVDATAAVSSLCVR